MTWSQDIQQSAAARNRYARCPPSHKDAFPTLPVEEISLYLRTCQFDVSEELLTQPSHRCLREFFEQILEVFLHLSPEHCRTTAIALAQKGNATLSHSDAAEDAGNNYVDALVDLVFFKVIKMFLSRCGIQDFALNDMLRPTPLRTQRVLSAIISFARFWELRKSEFDLLVELKEKDPQESLALVNETTGMKNRIENAGGRQRGSNTASGNQKATLERGITLAEIRKDNSKLEQELIEVKKSQAIYEQQYAEYLQTKTNLLKKLEQQNLFLGVAERNLKNIEPYVMADPHALRREIADLEARSRDAQQTIKDYEL